MQTAHGPRYVSLSPLLHTLQAISEHTCRCPFSSPTAAYLCGFSGTDRASRGLFVKRARLSCIAAMQCVFMWVDIVVQSKAADASLANILQGVTMNNPYPINVYLPVSPQVFMLAYRPVSHCYLHQIPTSPLTNHPTPTSIHAHPTAPLHLCSINPHPSHLIASLPRRLRHTTPDSDIASLPIPSRNSVTCSCTHLYHVSLSFPRRIQQVGDTGELRYISGMSALLVFDAYPQQSMYWCGLIYVDLSVGSSSCFFVNSGFCGEISVLVTCD
jgi:hypothetical protein